MTQGFVIIRQLDTDVRVDNLTFMLNYLEDKKRTKRKTVTCSLL
jgi:hypothetical protein